MLHKDDAMKLSEKKLLKQIIKESILVKIIGDVNEGHISNMARGIKGLFSKSEDVPRSVPKDVPEKVKDVQDISKIPETRSLWLLIGNEIKAQNDDSERTGSVYRWMGFSDEYIEKFGKIFKYLLLELFISGLFELLSMILVFIIIDYFSLILITIFL